VKLSTHLRLVLRLKWICVWYSPHTLSYWLTFTIESTCEELIHGIPLLYIVPGLLKSVEEIVQQRFQVFWDVMPCQWVSFPTFLRIVFPSSPTSSSPKIIHILLGLLDPEDADNIILRTVGNSPTDTEGLKSEQHRWVNLKPRNLVTIGTSHKLS
jgi:hypothetical protein